MTRRLLPFSRKKSKSRKKPGAAPGSLVHVGEKQTEKIGITVFTFDSQDLNERRLDDLASVFPLSEDKRTWINFDGIHSPALIEELGKHFSLHPLLLEDILNTEQRPKLEDYKDVLFLVMKMLHWDQEGRIQVEQISIVLGEGYVLSFQEFPADVFEPIRNRLRSGRARIRGAGVDYLAYALVDAIVDNYFIILENIGDRLEKLESEIIESPNTASLARIYTFKREMIALRKSVWPLRELISGLLRESSSLVREETKIFLRDVYDHTIQVIDNVETLRDTLASFSDLHLSITGNRMNEVMKVLTIIATIFIPLTFIAGIYGMNFEHMPELGWRWGYPAIWMVMLILAAVMLFLFRRKGWL